MPKPTPTLPELIAELDDCEREELELQRHIDAEREKAEGEFYGAELGKLEDVQAHVAHLKRQIGETLESLTEKV